MDQKPSRAPQRRRTPPPPRPAPPVIDEETAEAIRAAESYEPSYAVGYDPVALTANTSSEQARLVASATVPPQQRSAIVRGGYVGASRRVPVPPPPQDEEEYEDDYDEESALALRDAEGYDRDVEDDGDYVDEAGYEDGDDLPELPPTAMPVAYSGWLDLGQQSDRRLAQMFQGWKIKVRLDVSFSLLEAAERLQDMAERARKEQQRTGRQVNAVRIQYIRAILEDLVYRWNFVDERGHPLPQPPLGLRSLTPDLMAATLNRAIMEITPSTKKSARSTRR